MRYACRACSGTGKSSTAFDAYGMGGSGLADAPVCAHCHGTGWVAERPRPQPPGIIRTALNRLLKR
jgi:hypothetical protein